MKRLFRVCPKCDGTGKHTDIPVNWMLDYVTKRWQHTSVLSEKSGYNRHTAAKLLKHLWREGVIERRGGHGPGCGYEWRRR